MTEQQTKSFNLTLTQIAAAALAAVTAAVLGSRLGVAGTVIGAAIASITTTTANAVYQHSLERSLRRSRERLAAATRPRTAAARAPSTSAAAPSAPPTSAPPATRIRDAGSGADERQHGGELPVRSGDGARRRFAVAAGALAAFGLALVVVTGLEAVRGEPLSGGGGTTVGRVFGDATAPADRDPGGPSTPPGAPSSTPTGTPAPSSEPSGEPSGTTVTPSPTITDSTTPGSPQPTTTSDTRPTSPPTSVEPEQGLR